MIIIIITLKIKIKFKGLLNALNQILCSLQRKVPRMLNHHIIIVVVVAVNSVVVDIL